MLIVAAARLTDKTGSVRAHPGSRAAATVGGVSSRLRARAIVAACAVTAAALTVGLTLATRTTPPKPKAAAAVTQPGRPPLVLDLGVRTDAEAVALRKASNLYDAGKVAAAAKIFDRYRSPEAQVGASFSAWPSGFARLVPLVQAHPRSSVVQLHYGLALFWRGDRAGARTAWQAARRSQPDTPYAIRAEDLLHPNFPRGLPQFVPSFPEPAALAHLSPPRQLAYLRHLAATGGERGRLLYGVALQRLGRPVSALHEYEAAAALAPSDPEAKVAVAVGRFDKASPSRTSRASARSRSSTRRARACGSTSGSACCGSAASSQAKKELGLARDAGPKTVLGTEARRFLEQLQGVGTG